jgi:hypothetical protein
MINTILGGMLLFYNYRISRTLDTVVAKRMVELCDLQIKLIAESIRLQKQLVELRIQQSHTKKENTLFHNKEFISSEVERAQPLIYTQKKPDAAMR